MSPGKKLVNRAAVREAFHRRGARTPRGFIEDLELAVQVVLRRAAAGDVEPAAEAQAPADVYLKQTTIKEALREALGKDRIETAWVTHVNSVIFSKVAEAVGRSSARTPHATAVPSSVLRAFLRSPEAKAMSVESFLGKCKDAAFLARWTTQAPTAQA